MSDLLEEGGTPIELPDGVLVLTAGVDTQDDRFEYEIVGHGHFKETWALSMASSWAARTIRHLGQPGYDGIRQGSAFQGRPGPEGQYVLRG